MLYYKITAKPEKSEVVREAGELTSRERNRELAEKICSETVEYNGASFEQYAFTSYVGNKKAVFGAFCQGKADLQWILSYLEKLDMHHTDLAVEEITLAEIGSMIRRANRAGYIEDDGEIMEKLNLDALYRDRNEEFILEDGLSQKELFNRARELLSASLEEELSRIFSSQQEASFSGHPVHYIIETDDSEERQKLLGVLLSALYQKKRLNSKRYSVAYFNQLHRTQHRELVASNVGGTVVLIHNGEEERENAFSFHSTENIGFAMETMRRFQNEVLTVLCLPRACTKLKAELLSYVGNCVFVELKEDLAFGEHAKAYLGYLAKKNHIPSDPALYGRIIDTDKGFTAGELYSVFEDWRNVKLRTELYPQYAKMQSVNTQLLMKSPDGSAYEELQKMIGLQEVKQLIDRTLNYYKVQRAFKECGFAEDHPAMHMVFTGNPGTAKTTVARLFARIMKENGLLSDGNLYEVGRADLVGKYVGWTAQIVKDLFRKAKGSVIFIDEAYSLLEDKAGMYGDEAINTIVQEMENHREDIVVIFAGYPGEMETFLSRNPGLRSRIAWKIPFADYSADELYQITELIAEQKGMRFSSGVRDKLIPLFCMASKSECFGNGRYARSLVERARMNLADRLVHSDLSCADKKALTTLLPEDFDAGSINRENPPKKRIGFL